MRYSKWYHNMIEEIRHADDTCEISHFYRKVNRDMASCGLITVDFRNFLTRQIAYERAKKGEFYGCSYLSGMQEEVMNRMNQMNKYNSRDYRKQWRVEVFKNNGYSILYFDSEASAEAYAKRETNATSVFLLKKTAKGKYEVEREIKNEKRMASGRVPR